MVRNIPNRYTREMILNELNEKTSIMGTYDFLYLPIDFQNSCNLGYAFVNMVSPQAVIQLHLSMHGKPWKLSRSSKICQLVWGRLQGKQSLLGHFRGTVHLNMLRGKGGKPTKAPGIAGNPNLHLPNHLMKH